MIIDAHVHYTPPALRDDLDEFVREEPFWGLLLAPGPDGQSLQGWATAERMIADMDAAGVDKVVMMGEYRRSHEACVARNDQTLEIMRRWPDRVIGFAVVQPKAGRAALDELARCVDAGMKGVGELGSYGQGYRLDDPDFLKLAEACIRHDVAINLHTNEEVGRFYPGKATTPLVHYYELAVRLPELKLILAHWGGGLLFYELMPAVRKALANVWYDTAASPLIFPTARIFNAALACVAAKKILFASDYPLRIYPSRQPEPDMRLFLSEFDELGLDAATRSAIAGDNAAALLGLAPGAAAGPLSARRRFEIGPPGGAKEGAWPVHADQSVSVTAHAFPQTQAVFEAHCISWRDEPVPYWEPIRQAAAVRGYGPEQLQRLLKELNEAAADF
ncbi:MAG: amidohydrolase family protein [Nitrososphaerales archaeon]